MTCPHQPDCTVLFSGGSDSTLSSALMLGRFAHVHLLTCRCPHLRLIEHAGLHVPLLKGKFGAERLCHLFVDASAQFNRIFRATLARDAREFGTHLAVLVCFACKMAMHTRTIIYNLQHGVHYAAVGSRAESRLYPDQTRAGKEPLEQLYRDYGMELLSPVYEMLNTDDVAFNLGLSTARDMKQQFILYDSQPSCLYGGVAYIYARLFYSPLFGEETRAADARRYFEKKRPVMDRLIREHFAAKGQDVETLVRRVPSAVAPADALSSTSRRGDRR